MKTTKAKEQSVKRDVKENIQKQYMMMATESKVNFFGAKAELEG